MKKDTTKQMNSRTSVIGLDLADVRSTFAGLDDAGDIVEEGKVAMSRAQLEKEFGRRPPSRIALEAGTHSRWVCRLLQALGHEAIVANPRQVALISRNRRKSDRLDAITLARLVRSDPELLRPITHRGEQAQQDLAVLCSRDALVCVRTQLINHARGVVKSFGERLPKCSARSFHHKAAAALPPALCPALAPVIEQIAQLSGQIDAYDKKIKRLIEDDYPEAGVLQQPNGVGPITSLAYALTLEDPARFARSRDVAAYLGLTPGRRQTGASDPELHITKAGDAFLRRLLVQAAHYILGPFGTDCDLRRWGLRLIGAPTGKGNKQRRKRAVVATARKLAVLLHALWTTGETYDPLRQANRPHKEAA